MLCKFCILFCTGVAKSDRFSPRRNFFTIPHVPIPRNGSNFNILHVFSGFKTFLRVRSRILRDVLRFWQSQVERILRIFAKTPRGLTFYTFVRKKCTFLRNIDKKDTYTIVRRRRIHQEARMVIFPSQEPPPRLFSFANWASCCRGTALFVLYSL